MHISVEPSVALFHCGAGVGDAAGPDSRSVLVLAIEVVAGAIELHALCLTCNGGDQPRVYRRSWVATDAVVSFHRSEVRVPSTLRFGRDRHGVRRRIVGILSTSCTCNGKMLAGVLEQQRSNSSGG